MKISIISPTYNSSSTLSDTLESISNQSHKDIEHIIVDGLSSDNTLEIAKSYQKKHHIKIISEKDSGLYDAMNKGVSLASGEIIAILNSDDFYNSNQVLSDVNKIFESKPEIDAVYGDVVYLDRNNIERENRFWRAGKYSESKLNNGWIIPHPSLFIRKRVYDSLDKIFDTNLKLAADYELMLRLLKIKKIKLYYLEKTLVKMRDAGISSNSFKQRLLGWQELLLSWDLNKLKRPHFFIFKRVILKVSQFLYKNKIK